MIEWGKGEYLAEQSTPLADWFRGQNLTAKLRIEVASNGDLFGGKNVMLAIRHLRQNRVIHVPLAEAVAAGLPQKYIPLELRHREPHKHECFDCHCLLTCADKTCFNDFHVCVFCSRCKAKQELQIAEQALRDEQFRQPQLWEDAEKLRQKIATLKSAVTRAQRKAKAAHAAILGVESEAL